MIYDLNNLVKGLGGVEQTADAFAWFREQAVRAGLKGLHLQLTSWGAKGTYLSGLDTRAGATPNEILKRICFDSQTHYQMVHFAPIDRDYTEIIPDMLKEWALMDAAYDIPYFPHVSLGWDNNPRYKEFRPGVVKNNTPENVRKALVLAKAYADAHPNQPRLVTINSWNEWTETSYLQPDDLYGYGYLDAVKQVFSKK